MRACPAQVECVALFIDRIVVATGAVGAVPLWRVTAGENKIIARHGTVADFSKMQRVASLQEKLGQKGKLD